MKTVIFLCDAVDDVYNDKETLEGLLNGNEVVWKVWYDGDGRCRPTRADVGDRFFILRREVGVVAAGVVAGIDFKRGGARLSDCGMAYISLHPMRVGRPLVAADDLQGVVDSAKLSSARSELVLDRKADCWLMEERWLKAIMEHNASEGFRADGLGPLDRLDVLTVEALHEAILKERPACPCCGNKLGQRDELFFRPSLVKRTDGKVASYADLKAQYAILCPACAAIEKEMAGASKR